MADRLNLASGNLCAHAPRGPPLAPPVVRASVRKQPYPPTHRPKDDATTACDNTVATRTLHWVFHDHALTRMSPANHLDSIPTPSKRSSS
jgi:hypothetical protein